MGDHDALAQRWASRTPPELDGCTPVSERPPGERFRGLGYVVERALFSAEEATAILAAAQSAEPRQAEPNELSAKGMEFASNVFYRSAALQELVADPRIVIPLRELLGPGVWCRWDQAVAKKPGADWFPWHQDNGYTQLPDEHVQVWIALTAMTEDNGALNLAWGLHRETHQHRWVDTYVEMDTPEPDRVHVVEAEPGDVVFFSSLLPHATTPNRTDSDRCAYVAEYLPLNAIDRAVPPPHYVVSSPDGAAPHFTDLTPTWPPAGA